MVPRRLTRLPVRQDETGVCVFVARSWRARLLGLAGLRAIPRECALLLPGCSSIHTFGMRFAIDVAFLDSDNQPIRIARGVGPGRIVSQAGAAATLEWCSGA